MATLSFGTETWSQLRTVMLHRPTKALKDMNDISAGFYLYDQIPDEAKYIAEHQTYQKLLEQEGVEVLLLENYITTNTVRMDTLASLPYLHDIAVITRQGAILSKMGYGRSGEELVVEEALTKLGIPIFYKFEPIDHFEGCLLLGPDTLFIARTERHTKKSIEKFIPYALKLFKEIIYVEAAKARRFMHADMIYNGIGPDLSLIFSPAFLETYHITNEKQTSINFKQFMTKRGVELLEMTDEEQRNWGSSFVPLKPNVIFNYDISLHDKTKSYLINRGVRFIQLHPDALKAGGGSLRCLTLQILRQ